MPRPIKCRRICALPETDEFGPLKPGKQREPLVLSVDEYEVIRLIDWMELNQEECAAQMEVARTTVQAIYTTARKKIADALVNGRPLKIAGGNYKVCAQQKCCRRRCPQTCLSHEADVCVSRGCCPIEQRSKEDFQ